MGNSYTLSVKQHFNKYASQRNSWKQKAKYYHKQLEDFFKNIVPRNRKVLELGCGTGELLNGLKPSKGVGIDLSDNLTKQAKKNFPTLKFVTGDAQNVTIQEKFDYVILSDLIGNLEDVQLAFEQVIKVTDESSRVIISYYNFLWEPIIRLAETLGLKMPQPKQNSLSQKDIENILNLANFEVIKKGRLILIPIYLPVLSNIFNRYVAKLPIISHLCLVQYLIARKQINTNLDKDYSVSVIIASRNEEGNIEPAVLRTPMLGKSTELIFVEGHSKDNTRSEIKKMIRKYNSKKDIKLIEQNKSVGKGDAIRRGIEKAKGEIIMISDADLTVKPEELTKFYNAIRLRKGEMVIGSRLVYPLEDEAMRFLNIWGNKFFSLAFSFLLDQPINDTLCGTKVFFREDYLKIAQNRKYFGDFDPFGDFDLIFGATKLNLKILEIPIRYKPRTYGITNISRLRHGWLLLKMTAIAAMKLKFV